jgi:hypothetical protein
MYFCCVLSYDLNTPTMDTWTRMKLRSVLFCALKFDVEERGVSTGEFALTSSCVQGVDLRNGTSVRDASKEIYTPSMDHPHPIDFEPSRQGFPPQSISVRQKCIKMSLNCKPCESLTRN